jgi:hypothetical protein
VKTTSSVVVKLHLFSTTRSSPSIPSRTGVITAASSASPGEGVRSGSRSPSITNEPSCTASPKSPPYRWTPSTSMPWSIHSQMKPPASRGYASMMAS